MDIQQILLVILINFLNISLCDSMCDQRPFGGEMKCCDGKDSSCFVKVHSTRGPGQSNRICYCDSYCKFTQDCCDDYDKIHDFCKGARDCKVSNWTSWSKCSTECGFGTMERKRQVTQSAKNGGKKCPPLIQTRGCNLNTVCEENKYETAFILPSSYRRPIFGQWGYEKILPAIKHAENNPLLENAASEPTYSYCVHYKLVFKRESCKGTWADKFDRSVPVCMECQSRVMNGGHCRGEGLVGVKTRWTAFGIDRCQGSWIRLGPIIPNCLCTEKQFTNFVFI